MKAWTRNHPKLALALIFVALLISVLIASFAIFAYVASPNRRVAPQLFLGAIVPVVPFVAIGIILILSYRSARTVLREGERHELQGEVPYSPRASGYNGLAIAGFILAFGSTVVGLFVSIAALVQIKRTGQQGRGLALAGVWISAIAILLGTIGLIFAGIQGLLPWQY